MLESKCKPFFLFALTFALLLSSTFSTYASDNNVECIRVSSSAINNEMILLEKLHCSCGGNKMPTIVSISPWCKMSRGICEHGNIDHSCFVYGRMINVIWECDNCIFSQYENREEYKKECLIVNLD